MSWGKVLYFNATIIVAFMNGFFAFGQKCKYNTDARRQLRLYI